MALRISGKNLDIGDAYRTHVDERLGEALRKYFDGGFTGHVARTRETLVINENMEAAKRKYGSTTLPRTTSSSS